MNLLVKNIFLTAKRTFVFLVAVLSFIFFSQEVKANCGNINSSFTTSQTIICGPGAQVISFVNTSGGGGAAAANYAWYLNGVLFDNTSGLAAPTTSTISALGTYTYMLIAQDTGTLCLDTAIMTVFIRPIPVAGFIFNNNNQCAGTTITFTNTSTGTGGFTTYSWNFGDGSPLNTTPSPTHVYAAGGAYNVVLTVSNGAGCTSIFNLLVTVLPRPVVNIAGDDGDGNTIYCLAPIDTTSIDPVTFFNFTAGATSYSWDFGDGTPIFNTASLASFVHNYTAYGTYTVTMTATGANGCTTSGTLTVVFDKFVAASFSVPLAQFSGCAPHTVTPVNASQNADTYVWNFGDGSPPVTTNSFIPPPHTYTTGGSFTISLTASNSCNTSNSTVGPIVIVGAPVIAFTATPSPGCAPQTVTFGNTTVGAVPVNNFYWDFGNGNTLNGVKFPPPQIYNQGTWTIMLISANACGSDTLFQTIIIDTVPTALITVTPTVGCSPLTVTTVNNSIGGNLTYQWFIDGVLTYFTQNIPNQTFTAPAGNVAVNHTIRLRVTNGCGFDDSLVTITVHPPVLAVVNPIASTICAGSSFTFTQASLGTNLVYAWDFGNGNTSTSATPPAQAYPLPGIYNVSLIVTGFCGVDTAFATVTVNPIPAAPTALSVSICAGTSTTLTATAPGPVYQWYDLPVGGTLLQTGASYTTPLLAITTTYYVQSTALGCTSPRTAVTVTVNPAPVAPTVLGATICASDSATLTATAPGGTYEWYNAPVGGVLLNTGAIYTTPPLILTTTYYVQTTVAGCTGPRTAVTVTVNPIPAAPTALPTSICTGNTATLNATAPGGTYNWFDLPVAGTLLQTGASYTTPILTNTTTYYVQTTVLGCTSPMTAVTVTVNPIPVADIVPNVSAGCQGLVVTFNNNSTLGGTYNWTFAGAAPATSAIYSPPPITFTGVGSNMAIVIVNVLGCVMSDTVLINIAPLPLPAFTVVPNIGCSPITSVITNTSTITAGDAFAWDFGNGTTSTLQNPPNETYSNTGNLVDSIFNIQLVITAANGCMDSVTQAVTIHPNPIAAFTPTSDTICAGTNIIFINSSVGASSYAWNFGDATTSLLPSPNHTYPSPSNYIVQLISSTAFGCTDTIQQIIVVDSVPVAGFTNTTECLGFTTQFTNTSLGSIVNWSYNFGDGSPLNTTPSPTHAYASNGTYNVVLTVTNSFGCTNSITQSVIVNPVPVAAFNHTTVCFGTPTVFTDITSGAPINWIWDFGDGSPVSNAQNPSYTYALAGTYNVSLVAFGGAGCSDTIINSVTVNPVPTANFTFTSVCTNDTTFFNSTSLGAPNTFSWNFGDGFTDNTNNPSPNHVYTTANTFNVTLIAGYSVTGCTNTIIIPVVAYPHTVPNFTSTTPCLNAATSFTDITTNSPVLWTWNFGDASPLDNTQNPSHSYGAPATYAVTLTTENVFGCIDSITINTVVNPLPIAAFNFDTVCLNSTTTFTDQSISAVGWNWDFGDASTSTSNSPTHNYAAAGTYNVQLIVTNVFGCVDTIVQQVIVNPNPISSYTATTACHTYPTSFTDLSTAAVQWSWDYGDASPLDPTQSPSHVYANPGNYNVTLLVTNIFGCTNSSTQLVTVLPQPIANFSNTVACAGQGVQFTDLTVGAAMTNWSWDFGDGSPINNSQNPLHAYTTGGTYNTVLISLNSAGCADTVTIPVIVNTVPVPSFTATTTCQGNVTSFTDGSSDVVPFTWFYDFADGNNSVSQNPNYIYAAPGIYNVSLTITNINGCDSTFILPVTVNVVPVSIYMTDTVCIGSSTSFTDLSTGLPNSWSWNFGDGNTSSNGPNETHTYLTPGSFLTSLTVANGPGCSDQSFQVVVVVADVAADINAPNSACLNSTVTINDASTISSGFIASSSWDFGDGSPIVNALNTTHIYTAVGTYYITHLVTSNGGCVSIAIDTIVINPLPVADFTTANTCQIQPSNFTDISTGGPTTWNWDFGDTFTDNVQNPTHAYAGFGSYNVTLIITDANGCGDTVTNPVTVYGQPTAAFTNNVVCWGDTTTFNNTSFTPDGVITNTVWNFGDGTNSTLFNPDHTFQVQNDSFMVSLVITTSFGCIDTVTQLVTTLPIPNFNFGPTVASGCEDFTTAFNDLSDVSGGTIVNWLWSFGDGNFTYSSNPAHTYYDAGSYTVILTVTSSYGCLMTDTLNYPIIVYPRPVAEFTANPLFTASIFEPTINFYDQSTGATAWDWNFGNNNSSVDQNPVYIYPDTGTYIVTQIAYNIFGCSDTITHPVNIYGETTIFIPNAFSPNGTELNEIWLPIMHGMKNYSLSIFDKWGEEIFHTVDQTVGWNGLYKNTGDPSQQDVYVYKIFVNDLMDNAFTYIGRITLLR